MKKRLLLIITSFLLLFTGCNQETKNDVSSQEISSQSSSSQISSETPVSSSEPEESLIQSIEPEQQKKFETIGDWTGEKALDVGFYDGVSLEDDTLVFQAQHGMELELILFDPRTGQQLADKDFGTAFINVYGNNLAVRGEKEAKLINARLEELKSVSVPAGLNIWDYNVNSTLTQMTYVDEDGINLYDLATNQKKQLAKHPNVDVTNTLESERYKSSFFVDGDQQVLVRVIQYEQSSGYTLFNLANNKQTSIRIQFSPGAQEFVMDSKVCVIDTMTSGLTVVNVCDYLEPEKVLTYELEDIKEGSQVAANEDFIYYFTDNQLRQLNLDNGIIRDIDIKYTLSDPTMMAATKDNTILYIDEGIWYSIGLA